MLLIAFAYLKEDTCIVSLMLRISSLERQMCLYALPYAMQSWTEQFWIASAVIIIIPISISNALGRK